MPAAAATVSVYSKNCCLQERNFEGKQQKEMTDFSPVNEVLKLFVVLPLHYNTAVLLLQHK